jgi:hypothetical protein
MLQIFNTIAAVMRDTPRYVAEHQATIVVVAAADERTHWDAALAKGLAG